MSKTSRMHQQPAFFGVSHGAVVPDESASSTLVIVMGIVQRNVDGIRGAVMMRPQKRLLIRFVTYDEVHGGSWWLN